MAGYGKRYGSALADLTIGNMMAESILPSLLHEDPRYFRRGSGPAGTRLAYAATRIFVTRTDSGTRRFNFSEVLGNAYYPGERRLSDNVSRLSASLATDAISQVLKEFWPDIKHKLFHGK